MKGKILGPLIVAELLVAVVVSSFLDVPAKRPAAFGSEVLLHGAWALGIFIGEYVVTVIVIEAFKGRVASRIGPDGVEWESRAVADQAEEQMLQLSRQANDQKQFIAKVMLGLIDDRNARGDVETRITRVDADLQRMSVRVAQLERERG